MINFILSLFFGISILVLFRYFEKNKVNSLAAISVSYLLSSALAFSISFDSENLQILISDNLLIIALLGVSFFFGFVIMSLSIQKTGLSTTSVAANISVIIPIIIALIFYDTSLNIKQFLGLLIMFPAIYLFFKPENKATFKIGFLLFPLLLFFISGSNNSLMRQAELWGANDYPLLFIAALFSISFATSIIFIVLKNKVKEYNPKNISNGLLLGLLNFGGTYFFLRSLESFPSALFFPVYNLSFISLSAFTGVVIFKEKLSRINYIGLILIIIAVVILY